MFPDSTTDQRTSGEMLPSSLAGLKVHDHLCLIYETRQEQFAAVIPFMFQGLERGEKCVYIADENTASEVLEAMESVGIAVEAAQKSGALSVITKKETYLREGYFDSDQMICSLQEAIDSAKKEGFTALRVTGEMTWALGGEIGVGRFLEYEAKLKYFFADHDILAICQYNRERFTCGIIRDVILTHPLVINGEMLYRNSFYIPTVRRSCSGEQFP